MNQKKPSPDEDEVQSNAEEIADAADETPTKVIAPELNPQTKDLTTWDDAPSSHGQAAPKVLPEDDEEEDSIAAKLIYEGTDEADRERRLAASNPDFEP